MSLTVQHLNADSTFLLTFSPETPASGPIPSHHNLTILCDPWLTGDSIVTHPKFAVTKHTVRPYIEDLSLLPEPDIVLISQNKPDHCHEETLRQLSPRCLSYIVAEPGAAKAIRAYQHFEDPSHIIPLPKYTHRRESQIRFELPPLAPEGLPGDVSIAFIPARNYMTGLHNAMGITYQAPTASRSVSSVSTVDLSVLRQQNHPPMPELAPQPRPASSRSSGDPPFQYFSHPERPLSPPSPTYPTSPKSLTDPRRVSSGRPVNFSYPLTPPESPLSTSSFNSITVSVNNHPAMTIPLDGHGSGTPVLKSQLRDAITPGRPRPLSVLFTPHGMPYDPDLVPYVTHHLVPSAALPLTLLLHSFDRSQNPWYFGGNITTGSRGGSKIARALMARAWISAHDEAKDDRGISVAQLKTTRKTASDVRRELWLGEDGNWLRGRGWDCDVRSLGVGEEMRVGGLEPQNSV